MKFLKPVCAAALLACVASGASAQAASNLTVYGSIDQYLNYMQSSSGTTVRSLEDGAILRSRLGFRGASEELAPGVNAKFQLELGMSTDTGANADATRNLDRQSWVGVASSNYGEVRIGRQNGPIFARGGWIDYTTRTLGSVINAFGVPARYDNTLSYQAPRMAGVQFEVHASLPETARGNDAMVWQTSVDYVNDSMRFGYMGLRAKPEIGATVSRDVVYDNLFANWIYSKGTVYVAWVQSNNNTSNATSNNAGSIVSNVGGFNAGTNADLNNFYKIVQISADYRLTDQFRIGGLWGRINDQSGRARSADGGSIGGYYDLSKRTTIQGLFQILNNDTNGGWRPSGSAGLKSTFTAPADINGSTIKGVEVGIVHKF